MKRMAFCLVLVAVGLALAGCSKSAGVNARSKSESDDEFVKVSPEEKKFISAAQPFVEAVGARNYEQAYALLSSHARARMSRNQFAPSDDDKVYARNEANPFTNVKVQEFQSLMAKVEAEHGTPARVRKIYVQSTDTQVLSGRGEKLDVMFSIGSMPASVPANVRRASLRSQIETTLTPSQLKETAKQYKVTPEKLQKDPDFKPYFNLKVVLVEEEGTLRVGYFEFLPPSMLD